MLVCFLGRLRVVCALVHKWSGRRPRGRQLGLPDFFCYRAELCSHLISLPLKFRGEKSKRQHTRIWGSLFARWKISLGAVLPHPLVSSSSFCPAQKQHQQVLCCSWTVASLCFSWSPGEILKRAKKSAVFISNSKYCGKAFQPTAWLRRVLCWSWTRRLGFWTRDSLYPS